jgi:hypothetical protein
MRARMMAAGALLACECWTAVAAAEVAAPASASIQRSGGSPTGTAAPRTQYVSLDDKEHEVLMHSNAKLGGYGGPEMRVTSFLANPVTLVGAQASWVVNHRFLIGAAAYGMATRVDSPEAMRVDGNPSRLGLAYGGLRLGVVANPYDLLHLSLAILAGPGGLNSISSIPTRAEFEVGYERRLGHAEMFLVVEPEVAVEANVATFMRVALGASYRYVTAVEHPGLSSGNLSSPALSLALKFGVF